MPAEQGLREEDSVEMQRAVVVIRVVAVETARRHLVRKPTVDSLIKVRRLQLDVPDAQKNGSPKNRDLGPWEF